MNKFALKLRSSLLKTLLKYIQDVQLLKHADNHRYIIDLVVCVSNICDLINTTKLTQFTREKELQFETM